MGQGNVSGTGTDNRLSFADEFKSRMELTKAFCETAKSYIQISAAALALPIVFTQALLGKNVADSGLRAFGLRPSLVCSWLFFLLAIGFGLVYQWLAIRKAWDELHRVQFTDRKAAQAGFRTTWWVPQFREFNRSLLYGAMVVCFYVGAILFVVFAANSMRH